jgi:hypothetical protein
MRSIGIALTLIACVTAPLYAQTEGRVGVGVSVARFFPTDSDVEPFTGVGPLVRLNPKRGWGPAAGFSWFRTDIDNPSGAPGDFARIRIRPLMGGIAYTIGPDRALTSFSIVAGPSFNSVDFRDNFITNLPAGGQTPEIDMDTSFVVRPGVGVTFTLAPRVAVIGFGGYMFNRPGIVYRDAFGTEFRDHWKADAVIISVGAVYSLF